MGRECELHGGGRVAERQHETVAHLLHDLALVLDEQRSDDGVDPVEHASGRVVAAGFSERRE